MFYFSTKKCGVCTVLKPKIINMITENYPKIKFVYIDTEENSEIAAQFSIFTVPSVTIFFDGKETIRKSRYMGVEEISEQINRPYSLFFNN